MIQHYFEIETSQRMAVIETIVATLPGSERTQTKDKLTTLVTNYQAHDQGALWLLEKAAEAGKLEVVIDSLEKYERTDLRYKCIDQRVRDYALSRPRTQKLFISLADEIGVPYSTEITHYIN